MNSKIDDITGRGGWIKIILNKLKHGDKAVERFFDDGTRSVSVRPILCRVAASVNRYGRLS